MTPKISLITATVGAALVLGVPAAWGNHQYGDAFYRAEPATVRVSPDLVDRGPTRTYVGDDRFRIDHSNVPVQVSAPSSGRELEWPQIGIGFGIGIVLMLGLWLALRSTRTRPLAH